MRPAEVLLCELGISDPRDIDVDAIALCVGAEIEYRELVGCEAQIIGYRDRAVIHVHKDTPSQRRRFSAGHELGHWRHHRGQSFSCRSQDIGRPMDETSRDAERIADAYAADLLLPPFMVAPRIQALAPIRLDGIVELARTFSTSATAAGIRVIRMTKEPVILVAHSLFGKRWQWGSVTAAGVVVRSDIDARSSAVYAAAGIGKLTPPKKEPAGYWFDRRHIDQFEVSVQNMRTSEGEALSLVRIVDERLLAMYG